MCTKILDLCLFLDKDVKQWKFCKSKRNIETDDKKSMTVTFITNVQGTILPKQLIRGGKIVPSLTKFHFPEGFPAESIKIIK